MFNYVTIDENGYYTGWTQTMVELEDENSIYIDSNDDVEILENYKYKKFNRSTKEWEELTEEEYNEHFGDPNAPSIIERMVAALEYYNLIVE